MVHLYNHVIYIGWNSNTACNHCKTYHNRAYNLVPRCRNSTNISVNKKIKQIWWLITLGIVQESTPSLCSMLLALFYFGSSQITYTILFKNKCTNSITLKNQYQIYDLKWKVRVTWDGWSIPCTNGNKRYIPQCNGTRENEGEADGGSRSHELEQVPNTRNSYWQNVGQSSQGKSECNKSVVVHGQMRLLWEEELVDVGSQWEVQEREDEHEVKSVAQTNSVVQQRA